MASIARMDGHITSTSKMNRAQATTIDEDCNYDGAKRTREILIARWKDADGRVSYVKRIEREVDGATQRERSRSDGNRRLARLNETTEVEVRGSDGRRIISPNLRHYRDRGTKS